MKNNQPVTHVETTIPEGETLVSKTDLKGSIVSANDIFIKISGFTQDELYNKNHNVVRHPDIPPRVFEDLWETLKAGKPWSQVVKNRCKDGSHYWVRANACPILEDDEVVGYTSYRTGVTDAEKIATQAAYQEIAEGRLIIEQGVIYTPFQHPFRKLRFCSRLPLAVQSALGGLALFLLILSAGKWLLGWELPWSALLIVAPLTALGTGFLTQYLIKPLSSAAEVMREVSQQRYDTQITFSEAPEIRKLQEQLKMMQILTGVSVDETRREMEQNRRIRVALDNVSANVMVTDEQRNIIYMNEAVSQMLQRNELDIQQDIPSFQASGLVGRSIDDFHKKPEHQAGMLATFTQPIQSKLTMGERHFNLVVNPVIDESSKRLGAVVEWTDETEELQVQQRLNQVVGGVQNGELGVVCGVEGLEGFYKILAENINKMLEAVSLPINTAVEALKQMEQGDLTARMDGVYAGTFKSLSDSFNRSLSRQHDVIYGVRSNVNKVSGQAGVVASSADDLSTRAAEQASSLEQTAASMEQMASTVTMNADNAVVANELVQQTREAALTGTTVVQQAADAMGKISEASSQISEIIGLIDSIAFQTNLLALNAAVEAARAGEHGRGFAVVATEVRALAQRSSNASKEIRELIETSGQRVVDGEGLVQRSADSLGQIVEQVRKLSDLMGEITSSSQEQRQGIDQVNKAVSQLDTANQQNSAMNEELASVSESLKSDAWTMKSSTDIFRLKD